MRARFSCLAATMTFLVACSAPAGMPQANSGVTLDQCPDERLLSEATGKKFVHPDKTDNEDELVFEGLGCWYRIDTGTGFKPVAVIFFHKAGTSMESVTTVLKAQDSMAVDGADQAYTDGKKYVVVSVNDRVVSSSSPSNADTAATMVKVVLGTA